MKKTKALHLTLAAGVLALGATTAAAQSNTTGTHGGTTAGTTAGTTQPTDTTTGTPGSRTSSTTTASTSTDKTSNLASTDKHFIKKVADASMGEVEMGRLGADKAASSEVKQFAQKMVDDHTKANGELTTLASSKSVDISMDTTKHQKMSNKLGDKAGVDFDKAFMKQMVADHKKVVRDFEHEAKSGKDAEVKAWAEKMLPAMREHLSQAQSIYDGLKGTKTDNTTTRSTTKTSS
jgi:putative membrane protein